LVACGALDTFVNGSFWRLEPKNVTLIVERLRVLGYQAEQREDLQFW
jgi:hypothetical protein